MRRNSIKKRIDTTLGELIETLSEVAFEDCRDAKEAYTLAGLALTDVLSQLCAFRSDADPIKGPRQEILMSFYNDRYFNRCYRAFVRR